MLQPVDLLGIDWKEKNWTDNIMLNSFVNNY